jgi:hypothetical protein
MTQDADYVRVTPFEIASQRAAGWPDFHPEDYCHRCGCRNPIWYADSQLWNEVMGGDRDEEVAGIVCPTCFADLAKERFLGSKWKITGWRMLPDWGRP